MKLSVTWFMIIIASGLSLLTSCQSTQYLSNQNLEFLYNPTGNQQAPEVHIFHEAPENPRLYVKAPLDKLAYAGSGPESQAHFRLNYRIYKNYEYRTLFDSGGRSISNTKNEAKKQNYNKTVTFNIPNADQYYLLEVEVYDKVADQKARTFTFYRPYQKGYEQRFLVRLHPEGKIYTRSFIPKGQPFTIATSSAVDTLTIKRYSQKAFGTAAPPFKEDHANKELATANPDTIYTISPDKPIKLNKQGLYSIQGASRAATLSLRSVKAHYPKLKRPIELQNSIRYITSSSNFKDLKDQAPKAAVDQFWLNRANKQKAQAKEMIQRYYQRVQLSNEFFTNYKKGWKTDRGLIYIIFGKPYIVYRTNQQEVWIYANSTTMPNLEFRFERKQHPLAPEYYRLKRSRFYKDPFYRGVERLRESNTNP